jgi:predicted O-methyltransferase YrrM
MWESRGVSVEEYERRVRAHFDEYGLGERIIFHVEESIAMQWDGPIHALFIDGDHSTPSVKADIEKWVPFVPVGGVVLFHDCTTWASVKQAIDETMRVIEYVGDGTKDRLVIPAWEELAGGGSLCVFRRRK